MRINYLVEKTLTPQIISTLYVYEPKEKNKHELK